MHLRRTVTGYISLYTEGDAEAFFICKKIGPCYIFYEWARKKIFPYHFHLHARRSRHENFWKQDSSAGLPPGREMIPDKFSKCRMRELFTELDWAIPGQIVHLTRLTLKNRLHSASSLKIWKNSQGDWCNVFWKWIHDLWLPGHHVKLIPGREEGQHPNI